MKERHIYTVSLLTQNIRVILEDSFSGVWVEGEISNFSAPASGHLYFTLKDEASQLRAVIFKNVNQSMPFKIKDGLAVICFGKISVYGRSGQYQLYVTRIEPRGLGALQLAFEQLKKRLEKEGLFDPAHKKPIPLLPDRIGVVTSPTGAAIRDILNVTKRRFRSVHIILNPVRVQGEGASEEIARAIEEFNQLGNVDVIIAGRGGGSLEDLWAFNEEIVARAIYNSRIPVISSVGHEIDWTIADFVADKRAPTPSAAAELVIAKGEELREKIDALFVRLKAGLLLPLEQYKQRIDELTKALVIRIAHSLELSKERFKTLTGKLEALSPLNILSRGYSVSLKLPQKILVKDAHTLNKGDEIETRVRKGAFIGKVVRIISE